VLLKNTFTIILYTKWEE